MPRTYDQTSEERAEDSDYGSRVTGTDRSPDKTQPEFQFVTRPVPLDLLDEATREREQRRVDLGRDIVTRLSESIGADFSNVADAIENMEQVDLGELDNQGLLEVIAEAARVVAKSSSASARTEVDQLVELTSMREAVEPNYSVVLSGTNSIDIANNPQPVVPDSDNKEYNIRNLYMRSFPTNSKNIFVGDDRVAPSSGFMLRPGEWFRVGLDFRETELYMASEEQGAEVGLMGLF